MGRPRRRAARAATPHVLKPYRLLGRSCSGRIANLHLPFKPLLDVDLRHVMFTTLEVPVNRSGILASWFELRVVYGDFQPGRGSGLSAEN